ncbi:MAG: hypothetical protein KKE62_12015 [Proteobacteria bacterium]|nr:hypothetical protein [Pseudomonadota bacterium]MBU1389004.1 hypothetical protein [Pseudomonadota bacterium]MBU1543556.1 hypothetical protein [Pseudomonadota bacterium]MBU2429856.1 hypothetical protein [Pseudomonadota bacterium]MBU2482113.1 hypothetical protein [Pseudomonadota bacterium]
MDDMIKKCTAVQPTDRTRRLRAFYVENTQQDSPLYTIHFDRAIARTMKATEGEPMVLRRAKAFAASVEAFPVEIFPDEPFVGWIGGNPSGVPVGAEQLGARLEIEVDCYENISQEDRKIIKEEIIPYWKGEGDWSRHWFHQNYQMLPPETRNLLYGDPDPDLEKIAIITRSKPPAMPRVNVTEIPGKTDGLGRGFISDGMTRHHIGHSSFGYEKILKKGFSGVKKDARDRMDRLDWSDTEDLKKVPFLKGVIIAMDAAAGIGKKFAGYLRDTAAKEMDAQRKIELQEMAAICDHVPAHPARTFHEALQSVWFTQILNWCEIPIMKRISGKAG